MKLGVFKEIERTYGPFGMYKPGSWKEQSDRKFSPADARCVYRLLQQNRIIPPPEHDMVFLSPTANKPTHEIAMWQEDLLTRQGRTHFMAGDLIIQPDYYQIIPPSPDPLRHRFTLEAMNAFELDNPDQSVDLLWDRKGWLWYCTRMPASRPFIEQAFDEYKRVLKPGGSIVIDAIEGYKYDRSAINNWKGNQIDDDFHFQRPPRFTPEELYVRDVAQYEESTVDLMRTYAPAMWLQLATLCQIQMIGEGRQRVCVLTT